MPKKEILSLKMLSKEAFPQTLHSLSNSWLEAFMVRNNFYPPTPSLWGFLILHL